MLVLAAGMVGLGVQGHLLGERGVALVLVCLGGAVLTASLAVRGPAVSAQGLQVLVRTLVVVQIALAGRALIGRLGGATGDLRPLAWAALGVLAVAALDQVSRRPRLGRVGQALLLASVAALGLLWMQIPVVIDVQVFQEVGAQRLLDGVNPYVPGYPNPYPPGLSEQFYGPGLATDEQVEFGFPYPPLSLLLSTGGWLLGELRLAHLMAVVGTGGLLLWLGRDHWSTRAGGVLFATTPSLLFVVHQSWTESFVALFLALAVWLQVRGRSSSVLGLGLLIAIKQYAALLAVVLAVVGPGWQTGAARRRALLGAVGVAVAVTVPMALWGPADFVFDVFVLHMRQPYRPDSLSLLPTVLETTGWDVSAVLTLLIAAATLGALGYVLRVAPRTAWGAAAGAGVVKFAFLLFSKQAHVNYYFVVTAATTLAIATSDHGTGQPLYGSNTAP